MIKLYCGCNSQFTAIFPMKMDSDIASTLEYFILLHRAPSALLSDKAKAQNYHDVREILRMYAIADFQC
jgi:hypothetical protein